MRRGMLLLAALVVLAVPASALDGMLVGTGWGGFWYNNGDVVVVDCASKQASTIVYGACYGASFSPDGNRVAYFKDNNSIWICNTDGSGNYQVTTNTGWSAESHSCTNWIAGDWIYWGAGRNLKRVKIDGSQRNDNVDILPWDLMTCRVSQDGTRAGCFTYGWEAKAFTVGGADFSLGGGCQGSISPDGQWLTHNTNHSSIKIHRFSDAAIVADVACAGGDANNYAFSHLSNEYVCYTINGGSAYVMHWQSGANHHIANGIKGWDYNPNVGPPPAYVSIDYFTADPSTIQAGGSSTLSWGTTNATAVALDGQGVGASGSTQVWPGSTATYTLVADGQNGPVSQQVTVTVEAAAGPVTVPFRMNCGPNAQDSGWSSDDAYVSGGNDYLFGGGVDKSGVTDPAPDDVYLSLRHADPAFGVPIANDTYRVRLHFLDGYGDDSDDGRAMNVTIEGAQVLSAYSVKAAAGGTSKATVEEFDVTVGDGSLTIVVDRGSGNDAFVSGVEVVDQGSGPGPVLTSIDVNPPSGTIAVDSTHSLTAAPWDQFGNIIGATITWSTSGGTVSPTTGTSVTFTPSGGGTYTVTASSGGVSGSATVVVTDVPTVTVTSPVAGDIWYIGTTRRIRWQTSNMDNVSVFYSPDNGQTTYMIRTTVKATDSNWGDDPWTIPAGTGLPSNQCKIVVTSYSTEYRDDSGTFDIRAVSDGDGDGMDDAWETLVFGDTSHDKTTDTDGDGLTDYEEFMGGSNPLVDDAAGGGVGFGCEPGVGLGAAASLSGALLTCAAGLLLLKTSLGRGRRRASCR